MLPAVVLGQDGAVARPVLLAMVRWQAWQRLTGRRVTATAVHGSDIARSLMRQVRPLPSLGASRAH